MIAILGGLGAAVAWGIANVCSSRSSRMIDPASVVGWVMLVGLLVAAPPALIGGIPSALHGSAAAWLALAGAGNVAGLLLAYAAMRIGQVSLVAPVVSTEGAMAAVVALAFGESISPATGVMLAVIVLGVALASIPSAGADAGSVRRHSKVVYLAIASAAAGGASLYAAGRAGTALPVAWVGLATRIVGVPAITIPLALSGRLRLSRLAFPLVLTSGICEVVGFYAYTAGARHGIAIAAVLSSQFGAVAALVGYLVLGERLSRIQLCGVLAALAGVAALSLLQS